MINLGIVGIGNQWETRYKPALKKLSNRLAIKAIYAPVANRAKQVSQEFDAVSVEGINSFSKIADLQGILLLDTGWSNIEMLKLLLKLNKPLFLAESLNLNWKQLSQLTEEVHAKGLNIMPELGRRYMPSSARLQELIATQLGRPKEIKIITPIPCPQKRDALHSNEILRGLFDWCYYIGRSNSKEIHVQYHQDSSCPALTHSEVRIQYEKSNLMHSPAVLNLELSCNKHEHGNSSSAMKKQFLCEIICEKGTARIDTPINITWNVDSSSCHESLTSENSDIEVMLDHFCRRVVGGLIPTPDLEDYCRSSHLTEQVLQTNR
jgi:predicted dehydrogenase